MEPYLDLTSFDLRELYLGAGSRVMSLDIGEIPDALNILYVGYRGEDGDYIMPLLGDDESLLPIESPTDLAPQLESKRVVSVVFFISTEGLQGTDGETMDVNEIVTTLAGSMTVKLCGTLVQHCVPFHCVL